MYKKLVIIFILLILCCGCVNKEKPKEVEKKKVKAVYEEKYKDLNNTPIGFYKIDGNNLVKLTTINKPLVAMEDIGIFQIYPSNKDTVYLNKGFAYDFYDEWMKYNTDNNLKIGFNVKYKTDEGEFSYNIFNPSNCFDKWEYLLNYLYDDYLNREKGFYSHIENDEYNDSTLFTSFKMQSSGECNKLKDKILLTVFTYDSEDDFLNGEYRGNSSYTMTINIE